MHPLQGCMADLLVAAALSRKDACGPAHGVHGHAAQAVGVPGQRVQQLPCAGPQPRGGVCAARRQNRRVLRLPRRARMRVPCQPWAHHAYSLRILGR